MPEGMWTFKIRTGDLDHVHSSELIDALKLLAQSPLISKIAIGTRHSNSSGYRNLGRIRYQCVTAAGSLKFKGNDLKATVDILVSLTDKDQSDEVIKLVKDVFPRSR